MQTFGDDRGAEILYLGVVSFLFFFWWLDIFSTKTDMLCLYLSLQRILL